MDAWMDGWVHELMHGWVHELMHGWVYDWMHGWMDSHLLFPHHHPTTFNARVTKAPSVGCPCSWLSTMRVLLHITPACVVVGVVFVGVVCTFVGVVLFLLVLLFVLLFLLVLLFVLLLVLCCFCWRCAVSFVLLLIFLLFMLVFMFLSQAHYLDQPVHRRVMKG